MIAPPNKRLQPTASELPEARLETAYVAAVAAYLTDADADGVIRLGKHFQRTWLGVFPVVVKQFVLYAETREQLSANQKNTILNFATQRFYE